MNARGVKGRKRKPNTEPNDKAQSARFVEAAKELKVDESGQAFERAIKRILQRKTVRRKRI